MSPLRGCFPRPVPATVQFPSPLYSAARLHKRILHPELRLQAASQMPVMRSAACGRSVRASCLFPAFLWLLIHAQDIDYASAQCFHPDACLCFIISSFFYESTLLRNFAGFFDFFASFFDFSVSPDSARPHARSARHSRQSTGQRQRCRSGPRWR